MEIKFMKSKDQFYFLDYFVFVNKRKHKLNKMLVIQDEKQECDFYVKTFWAKSKLYHLDAGNQYTVNIGNIVTKRIYFFCVFIFLFLVALTFYFDNNFFWNLMTIVSVIILIFIFYIYTIGSKYFIKVEVIKS